MKTKQYEVQIYFSTFCTFEVEAESEEEAILKARDRAVKKNDIMTNLDNWKEADTALEIANEKVTNENPL